MEEWLKDPVGTAEQGKNPTVLLPMRSGYAVIGITQFLPGYCLLLASPEANHLSDVSYEKRGIFLLDMSLLGEAIMRVCRPRRVNYEVLGNSLPLLHAHVWPRYDWEPDEHKFKTAWSYPPTYREAPEHAFSLKKHGNLKRELTEALSDVMQQYGASPLPPAM